MDGMRAWEEAWTTAEHEFQHMGQAIEVSLERSPGGHIASFPNHEPCVWSDPPHEEVRARARLAAAAPTLARALAMVEFSGVAIDQDCCPACGTICPADMPTPRHEATCWLNAALLAAGLTPADREAVRERR